MRRLVLAVTLVLASTSLLHAQGRPGMGAGMGMGMPLDDASFRPTIEMLTTMLDLTPAQARQAVPFRDSLLAATKAARAEAAAAQAAMQAARQAGVSPDSLGVLRAGMQKIMMGMMPYRVVFQGQLRGLLDEAQTRKLEAHQQEMMGTMGPRMQGMRERP